MKSRQADKRQIVKGTMLDLIFVRRSDRAKGSKPKKVKASRRWRRFGHKKVIDAQNLRHLRHLRLAFFGLSPWPPKRTASSNR